METKICPYCNKRFNKIEFPQSFDRMITCGSVECMGKRRRFMWKQKYESRFNGANNNI
jgi:hypothetical protein